jgi:hypothetical protein
VFDNAKKHAMEETAAEFEEDAKKNEENITA